MKPKRIVVPDIRAGMRRDRRLSGDDRYVLEHRVKRHLRNLGRRLCLGTATLALLLGASLSMASGAVIGRPRLVVVIVIDAFRYDYLTRFSGQFGPSGFRALLDEGAVFVDAHVDHMRTSTGPGHAAVLTGASGAVTGIVDNNWWDRHLRRQVNCVEDTTAALLPMEDNQRDPRSGRSPRNLRVSTVGDQLRLATQFQAKVIGLSYKDRGAILPAGKLANGAYWYDDQTGEFVTSRYYVQELPRWVREFNAKRMPQSYFGKAWRLLLPDSAYTLSRQDRFEYEMDYKALGIVFPHRVAGGSERPSKDFYAAFAHTPWADVHLEAFARAVIENEGLGEDGVPDVLTVSFSATDRIGHLFGPYSVEVQDQVLRLDRVLARFFTYLDDRVGLEDVLVVVTADHGIGPIPEYVARYGIDAGRVDRAKRPNDEDSVLIPARVDSVLDERFGQEEWVAAFLKPQLYLSQDAIHRHGFAAAEVEHEAARSLLKVRGIAVAVTRSQLLSGTVPYGATGRRLLNQFDPERSGDVIISYAPYYVLGGYKSPDRGADHETGYVYDTHIPVIFFGSGVKPGRYGAPVTLNDIAPTVAEMLQVQLPSGNTGRILFEALAGYAN